MGSLRVLLIVIFAVFVLMQGSAQTDSIPSQELELKIPKSYLDTDRKWAIEIPIWVPGFAGEFSYGDVSIEGEDGSDPGIPENPIEPPDPGEPPIGGGNIISRLFTSSAYLKFFFMNRVTYSPGKFLFQMDAFAGAIGDDVKFKLNDKTVAKADLRSVLFRAFAAYSFLEGVSKLQKSRYNVYAYFGGRFHFFHAETSLRNPSIGFNVDPFWAEPIIGVQGNFMLKNWKFQAQADWGGFYINDNTSFMFNANVFYRISRLVGVKLGWNDWRFRQRKSIRHEPFYMKVHLSGPNTGVTFYF